MTRQFLYAVSAFAVAGSLAVGHGAVAAGDQRSEARYVAPSEAQRTATDAHVVRFDGEKNCWLADPFREDIPATGGDWDEPNARYDAAKECVATGTVPPSGAARDGQMAYFDATRNCWVVDLSREGLAGAGGDWSEPTPRYDAANECVAGQPLRTPGVAEQYTPARPSPPPGG